MCLRRTGETNMKKTIASAILAFAGLSTSAQEVWVGGVDNNWNTGGNWLSTVAPVGSNTLVLVFGPPGTTFTPTAPIPYLLNGLVLSGGTGYAISGIRLTFDGVNPGILVQAPGSSISNDLRFAVDTLVSLTTPITFTGLVDGAGGMGVTGGSSLTFASNSIYAGTTVIDTGTTLRLGNGAVGPGTIADIVNNGILEFDDPSNPTVTGLLVGSGSVRVVDHAAGGSNWLHTGTTTIDAGANAGASITNNALLTVNGIFDTNGSTVGSLTGSGVVNIIASTFTMGGDNTDQAFTGNQFGGAGDVVKVGTGRQVLAHTLTYAGTTTINGGTLAFGNGATGPGLVPGDIFVNAEFGLNAPAITVPGVFGTGNVTVTGGTATAGQLSHTGTTTVDAGATLTGPITTGTALLTVNGIYHSTGSTVGSLAGAGTGQVFIDSPTLILGGDNTDRVYAGINLGGAGSLVKNGTGRQTIAVTGMYFGNTTINAGTLRFGNGVIPGPGFVFSTIVNNGAIEFNVPSGVSFNDGLSGSGTMVVAGGSATVTGTTLHTGTTTIDAGATFNGAINNNALLTVNGAANLGPQPTTVGSLTGSGNVNVNAATFTVGGDNTSTTYSGTFGGGGNTLVKVGTGTLTLTGNSAGVVVASNVNAGTLLVNGQHIASTTIVASGATFGGSGTVGPVIVNAGGTLAPGNSPGLLTTASLFLAGTLLQEIQGPARGAQYDAVDANGGVNITGSTLTLSGAYVPVAGNTFTIIANDGVDPVTGTFNGLAEGATIVFNGVPLRISYVGGTGNDVVLSLAPAPAGVGGPPIPTLNAWMLMLLALLIVASAIWQRPRGKGKP
jgi:fibronectin-binding autotransporter adhesin